MYDRISGYRKSLVSFVASVVFGGLAISFLSTIAYAVATGSGFTTSAQGLGILAVLFLVSSGYLYLKSQSPALAESDSWDFLLRFPPEFES